MNGLGGATSSQIFQAGEHWSIYPIDWFSFVRSVSFFFTREYDCVGIELSGYNICSYSDAFSHFICLIYGLQKTKERKVIGHSAATASAGAKKTNKWNFTAHWNTFNSIPNALLSLESAHFCVQLTYKRTYRVHIRLS